MKIKEKFDLSSENGQYTVVSSDKSFNTYIVLGTIAALLFRKAKEKDCSKEELLTLILKKSDISTVLALSELNSFIKTMKENDIFE
ncbi:MAG: hypothetical protein MJ080_03830 [Clostridia bacterium]|nr:hypothetical protein [Clostridia bacterium]